jgi:hypothetical protein
MHIHPTFALTGAVCCYLLMLWLVPATVFATIRRKSFSAKDGVMFSLCMLVAVVIVFGIAKPSPKRGADEGWKARLTP